MHLHFLESEGAWQKLLPLTYTRPVADLRVGILKIQEKWSKRLDADTYSYSSQDYLSELFQQESSDSAVEINANVLPDAELVRSVANLKPGRSLRSGDLLIAKVGDGARVTEFEGEVSTVIYPWDIFRLAKQEIERDYDLITEGRTSQPISDPHTRVYGKRIFLEEGATTKAAILNSEDGAIYLGKNSEVKEGAIICGSFALGEQSVVNLGAKMRGDSSIGPYCKVGGEIFNSCFQAYANKGHEGFLGNSVIGERCNIGADTNNSNLKNNYAQVKMWDFDSQKFKDTGLQFCGLVMGDHSKCGINTMFNTGTTVGVSANIFGSGFPRTIIPSFAWGGATGFGTYNVKKAKETADLVFQRRNKSLTPEDQKLLDHVFELTADQRVWEK